MPALNLGYLLRAANTGLASARQGTRERQEMERQREIEDSQRLFNEWAKRSQIEHQARQQTDLNQYRMMQDDRYRDLADAGNKTKLTVADLQNQMKEMAEAGRNNRFAQTGQIVQD